MHKPLYPFGTVPWNTSWVLLVHTPLLHEEEALHCAQDLQCIYLHTYHFQVSIVQLEENRECFDPADFPGGEVAVFATLERSTGYPMGCGGSDTKNARAS